MAISAGEGERGAGVNSEGQGEKRGFRVVSRGDPEVMEEGGKFRHEMGAHQPEGGTVEQGMAHIGWRGSGCPRPGGEIRAKVAMSVRVGAVAAEGGAEVAMRRKKGALLSPSPNQKTRIPINAKNKTVLNTHTSTSVP